MNPKAIVITPKPGDLSNEPVLPGEVIVDFHWEGVDRPCTGGIVCKAKYAPRLVKACEAGVLFKNPTVTKDVNGKTYMEASCQVWAKHLDTDLKKLGY